jgi:hypothetical protein
VILARGLELEASLRYEVLGAIDWQGDRKRLVIDVCQNVKTRCDHNTAA